MKLTRAQQLALEHITSYARVHKKEANQIIHHVRKMSNISEKTFNQAVKNLQENAKIGLHFHPDRPDSAMKSVAEALLEQGKYKSQFETLISNGSVSAYSGGARDLWEEKIFGGAYQTEGTTNQHRPKYGALNLMLHPDGPSPRFGSCYFLLSTEVSYRATYTYLDSHEDTREKGTYKEFDFIMAGLLAEIFTRDFAIGERNLTPTKFIHHLLYNLQEGFNETDDNEPARNLNHYIEAQIHGDISLKEDVEILVADPCFQGTKTGNNLEELCATYSIDFYWHMGFVLPVNEVPKNFRGPTMPNLAKRIASNGYIDASIIGAAVREVKENPDTWKDHGTVEQILQELKLLWHVLVKYGKPKP